MAPPASPRAASHAAHSMRRASLDRMFSRTGSRRHSLEAEHAEALDALKARIVAGGLALPPALIVAGDLDSTLMRFLRARKYNVDLAYAMLEKSLAWRAKTGADTILEQPMDAALTGVVRQCRPSSYIGHDSEHHPIFIERLGKLDGRRMEAEGVSDEAILAYHLREMEFMGQVVFADASSAAGHTVDRVVSVMDAQGLTLAALTGFAQRLFRLITAMDSDNYPETCHAIYIVNGGTTFSAIWRLVSPFVDKGTRDKVHVLGSGKAMQKVLFDAFGPALVPSFLGGTLDYDAVRAQWTAKMDAAIAERQQNPKGQQPPVAIVATSANGHAGSFVQQQHSGQLPQVPELQQQQQLQAQQSHAGAAAAGAGMAVAGAGAAVHHWWSWSGRHSHSRPSSDGGADGFATPMSGTTPRRLESVTSVYYDAQEPPSPSGSPCSGSSGGGHEHHFAAALGSATGADSMSVGPQSYARSQLSQQSGFTTATVGQGVGSSHGLGGHDAGYNGHGHGGHGLGGSGGGPDSDAAAPPAGCRCCVIS